MTRLTDEEKERYGAHIALCEIDLPGQRMLMEAKVLAVGAGALASTALLYLAAAGVGTIGICDGDIVSLSNLQRQIIHSTSTLGEGKTTSAAKSIERLNPYINVRQHQVMLSEENAEEICKEYDLILDCTDNYKSRLLVSDIAVKLHKPVCIAAVSRFNAMAMTHVDGSATYRTVFPNPPEEKDDCSCAANGVLNAVAGMAGCIQAAEAIKLITGTGELLVNRMLLIDSLTFEIKIIKIKP